jgi:hypothetical protein
MYSEVYERLLRRRPGLNTGIFDGAVTGASLGAVTGASLTACSEICRGKGNVPDSEVVTRGCDNFESTGSAIFGAVGIADLVSLLASALELGLSRGANTASRIRLVNNGAFTEENSMPSVCLYETELKTIRYRKKRFE